MRRFLLAALLAALLVPVVAEAANPVYSAAKRSANARSSTMQIRTATTVAGLGTVFANGVAAQRGQSVRLVMSTSVAGVTVSMQLVGLMERGHFVMYMRSPLFEPQLPPGKDWIRFDLQKQGEKLGIDFSSLLGSSQAMAPLWHGLVATTSLGRETVAGRSARRFRARVDYQRAAAAMPAFGKQLAAIESATGVRLGRVSADVWVGSDGYVRRFRTTTPTVVNGTRGTSVQTITYTGYNVPVTIAAPPRGTVLDFPG
jgi:hypothetical protein